MHRWIDHTAEVELEISAPTEVDVLADALAAFRELIHAQEAEHAPERRELEAVADDRAALLADFIEELVYLAETEGFVPVALEAAEVRPGELRATVVGHLGEPPHVVKAVTYHRLEFAPDGDGFRARVILDV